MGPICVNEKLAPFLPGHPFAQVGGTKAIDSVNSCLLYTSDAADERSSVDLGGRRIIKKKTSAKNAILRNHL